MTSFGTFLPRSAGSFAPMDLHRLVASVYTHMLLQSAAARPQTVLGRASAGAT